MRELKPAILLYIAFTIICGGIYPLLVTGIARTVFPGQAAGSFITDESGKEVGSRLIGQPFSDITYFWPRPSATSAFSYNPLASGGSNFGPTNPDYLKIVGDRARVLRDTGFSGTIPADLVQASASGLDPHISIESADLQLARVATARGISRDAVKKAVVQATEDRQLGFMGAPRVNVLELNLALDTLKP